MALRTSILAAVKTAVAALALPGIKGVFVRKGKRSTAVQRYPCVEVSRDDVPDEANRLGFGYDSPGYPVRVVWLANDPLGGDSDTSKYDEWHQILTRAFMEPETLRALVPGVWGVDVKPLQELDQDDRRYQHVVGGIRLVVKTFEVRGAGA